MKYVNDAELKRIGNMTPFSIAIEIQDLRKERDLANENVRVYSGLSAGRATKINALESNLMEARKQLDALESNISNLNEAYGDLLARFNAREEDFVRVQKRFDFEHDRADKNYAMTEESRKIIVKQTNELRQANDLYMMVSNNNNHLNKVIEDLKAAPAIPKHATWEAIAEREKELKCEAFRRINELEAEVAAWKCNSCSDNCIKDNKELQSKYDKLKDGIEQICSDNGIRE